MPKPTILERRNKALDATMREFKNKSFELGSADCMKQLIYFLVKGGSKVPKLKAALKKKYNTPLEARQALRAFYGVESVVEFCDKFFERIPPAAALPGDALAAPACEDNALGAVMLAAGNDLCILFDEEHDKPVMGRLTYDEGLEPIAAWRTLP